MKIHQGSDLHLEFGRDTLEVYGGADVLILNGDICVPAHIRLSEGNSLTKKWKLKKLAKRYADFFRECSEKYTNVLYVFGNHEFYFSDLRTTVQFMRDWFTSLGLTNITILDNSSTVIDGIKFFGATFWTDLKKGDPLVEMDVKSKAIGLGDFEYITSRDEIAGVYGLDKGLFTTSQFTSENKYSFSKLRECLSLDEPTIVITHHAPSYQSISPEFKLSNTSYAYVNDLDYFIEMSDNLKFWFHGHTHANFLYKVGQCLVICNPRGYFGKSSKKAIRKFKFLEVEIEA